MTAHKTPPAAGLTLEYDIAASPAAVWKAVTTPAMRAQWLPDADLADAEPVASDGERCVSYRMRASTPPFRESLVTFVLSEKGAGTRLRIVHELTDRRLAGRRLPRAANGGGRTVLAA